MLHVFSWRVIAQISRAQKKESEWWWEGANDHTRNWRRDIFFLITQEGLSLPRGDPSGNILWLSLRPFCHPVWVHIWQHCTERGSHTIAKREKGKKRGRPQGDWKRWMRNEKEMSRVYSCVCLIMPKKAKTSSLISRCSRAQTQKLTTLHPRNRTFATSRQVYEFTSDTIDTRSERGAFSTQENIYFTFHFFFLTLVRAQNSSHDSLNYLTKKRSAIHERRRSPVPFSFPWNGLSQWKNLKKEKCGSVLYLRAHMYTQLQRRDERPWRLLPKQTCQPHASVNASLCDSLSYSHSLLHCLWPPYQPQPSPRPAQLRCNLCARQTWALSSHSTQP